MQSRPISHGISKEQLDWARERLDWVIFNCYINVRLINAGICNKFIHQMDELEYQSYDRLVSQLLS